MTIIIDSREKNAIKFPPSVKTTISGLYSGDYSFLGGEHLFSVEKKDIADLVGSLTSGRARFERELHRMRGYQFKRLLVIGCREDLEQGNYRSKATPKSILASLNAFEIRYDIPVIFATPEHGAELIVRWAYWFAREVRNTAAKIDGK